MSASGGINKAGLLRGNLFQRAMTRADMDLVARQFVDAATLCREAGFDAVEIHLGHGYLPSEFFSPRLNRRRDAWGGSLENRARFARSIATAVREAAGPDMAVLAKLNMDDGVPGGLWLDESVEIGRMLESDGTLDALITQSPQSMVHAAVAILANARDGRDPMAGVEPVRFSIVMRENLP